MGPGSPPGESKICGFPFRGCFFSDGVVSFNAKGYISEKLMVVRLPGVFSTWVYTFCLVLQSCSFNEAAISICQCKAAWNTIIARGRYGNPARTGLGMKGMDRCDVGILCKYVYTSIRIFRHLYGQQSYVYPYSLFSYE